MKFPHLRIYRAARSSALTQEKADTALFFTSLAGLLTAAAFFLTKP